MSTFNNTEGTRIQYPPPATGGHENLVMYVRLRPGEKVQWFYAHTVSGSYVTGYDIVPAGEQ